MIRFKNIEKILISIFLISSIIVYKDCRNDSTYQVEKPNIRQTNYARAYNVESSELKEYEVKESSVEVYDSDKNSEDNISVGETENLKTEVEEITLWYTEEEQKMMEYIIQQEVRGATLKHKRIIAQVIVNRVKSEKFPDTITEVILAKNQFSSVSNYYNHTYEPDEDTKQAVKEVLNNECEDLSNGALFFYSPKWANKKSANYFENNLTFLFELEGHRFFK